MKNVSWLTQLSTRSHTVKVRVIPSGAPTYTPFFFQPGSQKWDFSISGAGALNSVPVCDDVSLTVNCVIRTGIWDGYGGYRNWNGWNVPDTYAFVLNHASNLGYAGRVPYAKDGGVSATVWVR
ncbi:hypothetical protein CCP4SC76_7610002 [Gammaproteobacteria bacterium]